MEENMQEKLEEIAMMIIANSGQARSDAFAALQEAKKGNFEDAEKLLKEAEESLQTAHESHRELLKMDASGEVTQVSILLCHAQDHLMGSALALDLIREMIVLSKVGKSKEESYGTKSIIDLRRWDVYRNSDA